VIFILFIKSHFSEDSTKNTPTNDNIKEQSTKQKSVDEGQQVAGGKSIQKAGLVD
jgi:hypothetical protein